MSRNRRTGALAALLAAPLMLLSGCSDLLGPDAVAELHWEVESPVISKGETFTITVTVINPTDGPLPMTSACGGVLYQLLSDSDDTELSGAQTPCLTYIKDFELSSGGRAFQHEATLVRPNGDPAGPGMYTIKIWPLAGPMEVPVLTVEVRVTE